MSSYDPEWREAQNLAYAACRSKDPIPLLRRSLHVSDRCSDAYQRTAVKAWPFEVLIRLGHIDIVMDWLPKLLSDVATLEEQVRRVDALLLLYQAVEGTCAGELVREAILTHAQGCTHWKCPYLLYQFSGMVAQKDVGRARAIAEAIPPGRFRMKAVKELADGSIWRCRQFMLPDTQAVRKHDTRNRGDRRDKR